MLRKYLIIFRAAKILVVPLLRICFVQYSVTYLAKRNESLQSQQKIPNISLTYHFYHFLHKKTNRFAVCRSFQHILQLINFSRPN